MISFTKEVHSNSLGPVSNAWEKCLVSFFKFWMISTQGPESDVFFVCLEKILVCSVGFPNLVAFGSEIRFLGKLHLF